MSEATRIANVLGGRKVLGVEVKETEDLVKIVRRGLPYKVLPTLETYLVIKDQEQAGIWQWVLSSSRTHARRRIERLLKPDESDRAMRVARVFARAEEVLGNREKAGLWLRRPNRALGMAEPLSLLDNDLGAQQVTDVLGRIEHGTFS